MHSQNSLTVAAVLPKEKSDLLGGFGDSVWGGRLQVLWFCFVAIYSYIGSHWAARLPEDYRRLSSTILTVVAGVLLLAVLTHIICSTDKERVRRTLIIAFGACVLLIDTSLDKFGDNLAAAITVIFALLLARLIWAEVTGRAYFATQYTALVSFTIAWWCGLVGLIATLCVKRYASAYYVLSPEGTYIVCGLANGLALGSAVLPATLPWQREISEKRASSHKVELLILTFVCAIAILKVNRSRPMIFCPNVPIRFLLALAYGGIFMLVGHRWLAPRNLGVSNRLKQLARLSVVGAVSNGICLWLVAHFFSTVSATAQTRLANRILLELALIILFLVCLSLSRTILLVLGEHIGREYTRQTQKA